MGFFGSKKDKKVADESSYILSDALEEGNLPVATPVTPGAVAVYPNQSQPPPSKKGGVVNATVVPVQPQVVQQEKQSAAPAPLLDGATLGRKIMTMDHCPACGKQSRTRTRTYPSIVTWVAVFILVFVFWPICWIPLVVDMMKTTDHFCVECETKVGSVGPFQDCCEKKRY